MEIFRYEYKSIQKPHGNRTRERNIHKKNVVHYTIKQDNLHGVSCDFFVVLHYSDVGIVERVLFPLGDGLEIKYEASTERIRCTNSVHRTVKKSPDSFSGATYRIAYS